MRDQITSGDICFKKAYKTKKNIKNVLTKDFSTLYGFLATRFSAYQDWKTDNNQGDNCNNLHIVII